MKHSHDKDASQLRLSVDRGKRELMGMLGPRVLEYLTGATCAPDTPFWFFAFLPSHITSRT
jgi:hypothetical protein